MNRDPSAPRKGSRPTAIDLFAGAGGATEGLARAGFTVLGAIEIDRAAAESYRANHPSVALREEDVTTVDEATWRKDLKLERGELALLKTCPPCQGFSSLGRNHDESRNDLVLQTWRFVREFRPRVVLLENVPGLEKDWRFARLVRQLRSTGYSARAYRVDAEELGVPQRRRRLILIATRETALPLPAQFDELPGGAIHTRMTAGDALKTVRMTKRDDPLNVHRQLTPKVARRVRAIGPAGSRYDLPPSLQLDCHKRLKTRSASSSYGRIDPTVAAPTMTTRCTTPACERFLHPTENRGLTLREAAVLQTFPLTYVFKGNYGEIERHVSVIRQVQTEITANFGK